MHQRVAALRKPSSRQQLRSFIHVQQAHIQQFVSKGNPSWDAAGHDSARYRAVASSFVEQVRGMHEGYNAAAAADKQLTLLDILELNYDGDAFDIVQASESGVHDYVRWAQKELGGRSASHAAGEEKSQRGGARAATAASSTGWSSGGTNAFRFASRQQVLDSASEHDAQAPAPESAAAYPLSALPTGTDDLAAWTKLSQVGHCTAAIVAFVTDGESSARAVDELHFRSHASGSDNSTSPAGGAAGGSAGGYYLPPHSLQVLAGHNTWADYLELSRIMKTYKLRLSHPDVVAAHTRSVTAAGTGNVLYTTLFSSYPGMVTSTDDWYQLPGSGLLVTETTTSAVRAAALRPVTPASGLPAWLRVSVANAVAGNGKEWAATFKRYSGGTYNCMWMVVDAHAVSTANARFAAAHISSGSHASSASGSRVPSLADLPDGTLTVIEQSPRRTWTADVTPVLRATGLWVSANRPFSNEIRGDLGYPTDSAPAAASKGSASASGHAHKASATAAHVHEHTSSSASVGASLPSGSAATVASAEKKVAAAAAALADAASTAASSSSASGADGLTLTTVVTYSTHVPASTFALREHIARLQEVDGDMDGASASTPAQLARFLQVVREEDAAAASAHLPRFAGLSEGAATTPAADDAAGLQFIARGRAGEGIVAPHDDESGEEKNEEATAATTDDLRFMQRASTGSQKDGEGERTTGAGNGNDHGVSGHSAHAGKQGEELASRTYVPMAYFSFADNPRGRMLARLSRTVRSVGDMQRMMWYNDNGRDAESKGRPYLSIAARFDLAPKSDSARAANGAIDFKVATVEDVLAARVHAVLGPTSQETTPFNWLKYDGQGFCGTPVTSACASSSAAGAKFEKQTVDASRLCTPSVDYGHRPAVPDVVLATTQSAVAAPGVELPCRWVHEWGVISV